jgi:hypothetical protein
VRLSFSSIVGAAALTSVLLASPAWAETTEKDGPSNPAASFLAGTVPGAPAPATASASRAPYKPTVLGDLQLSFSSFTVSYSPYGQLSVKGVLMGDTLMTNFTVNLQYSPDGVHNWTTTRTLTTSINSAEPTVLHFSANFFQNQSGYWRAQYAGDPMHAVATSKVVKAWRWATYFTGFKVSTHKVRLHGRFTVSGTLNRWFSNTRKGGYGSQTVEIIFHFKGKKTWYLLAKTKTNAQGRFSKKIEAYGSGSYQVIFAGGSGTFASGSPTAYVKA